MLITNVAWAPILLTKSGLSVARTGLVLAGVQPGKRRRDRGRRVAVGHRLSRLMLSAAFAGSLLTLGLVGQVGRVAAAGHGT